MIFFKCGSACGAPVVIDGNFKGYLFFTSKNKQRAFSDYELFVFGLFVSCFEKFLQLREYVKTNYDLLLTINSVPLAIYWKDSNLRYVRSNKHFQNFVGLSFDEIVNKSDDDIFPENLAKRMKSDDKRILKSSQPMLSYETEYVDADNQKHWLNNSKLLIHNEEENSTLILGVFEEVTKQKSIELEILQRDRQLERSLDEIRHANNAKSEFLSRMSHEIRTPLNAIIGMTHIAKRTTNLEKIDECLGRIDTSAKNLLDIINDILDMSRIEEDKLEIVKENFSLEKILATTCNTVYGRISEKSQRLSIDVSHDVDRTYIGDGQRLSQVIINLLSNAIKFSDENNDIKLKIDLLDKSEGYSTLQFSIIDHGIGLTNDQLGRLFQTFEQGDGGMTRKYGGTGLGLSISKKLVELMGGRIWAQSVYKEGSTFTFTVVLKDTESKDRVKLSHEIDLNNLRVIVVDDSYDTLEIFLSVLGSHGINTSTALSGKEALKMISESDAMGQPFQIAFVDWKMPGLDGIKTAKLIKETNTNKSVVVLISIAELSGIRDEAEEAGISRFLSKPLFPDTIISTINEIMCSTRFVPTPPAPSDTDFTGKCILLAEDMDINREVLMALVESTNVKVEVAENGKIAVGMVRADPEKYDMVFMDIHMPVMGGYEALKEIRMINNAWAKKMPIVAMTANALAEDIIKSKESGMDDHISKPINQLELFDKMTNYMKLREKSNMSNQDSNTKSAETFLPYFDIEDGLSRLLGKKKLLSKLLLTFKNEENMKKTEDAIAAQDIKTALEAVHTVKGTSANLSLRAVNEAAIALEADMKGLGMNVTTLLPALKAAYDTTISMIDEVIAYLDV